MFPEPVGRRPPIVLFVIVGASAVAYYLNLLKINLSTFSPRLKFSDLDRSSVSVPNLSKLNVIEAEVELGYRGSIHSADIEFLFSYNIFPRRVMDFVSEWSICGRRMRVGDLIIQRAFMPPLGAGICLEFAVRVTRVFESGSCRGFEYVSLEGHPEAGTSRFCIKPADPFAKFCIRTESSPGTPISSWASGFFTNRYQKWCTMQAIQKVKTEFQKKNPCV